MHLIQGQRDEHWDRAASKEGLQWTSVSPPSSQIRCRTLTYPRQWHWSKTPTSSLLCKPDNLTAQYNAWCLNNGDHQTMKRGHENWNSKIIWKMRMELECQWDLVEEEVSDVFTQLLEAIKKRLESLKSTLQGG